ncbi:MAG: hypothetical protein KC431_31275, partial [Myxococcales bacterium]|nr:hypothetical protein [Myxococcales bacterium]
MGGRVATLLLALGLLLAPEAVAAPGKIADPESTVAPAAQPRVLLLADDDELGRALTRAMQTELNDVAVALHARPPRDREQADDLEGRIAAAEATLAGEGALALIWIEPGTDGGLVIYLVAEEGLLRRPIAGASPDESVEAAAVIVRHLIADLVAGEPIGLTAIADEPAAGTTTVDPADVDRNPPAVDESPTPAVTPDRPEPPPPLLADRTRVRLQVAYLGQTWVHERPWENTLELGLGVRLPRGAHFGLSVQAAAPYYALEQGVELRVRRIPFGAFAGFQHVWTPSRLALDASLRVLVELGERRALDSDAVEITRRWSAAPLLEPRLQLDWLVAPPVSLFLAAGVRVALIDYDLVLEDRQSGTRTTYVDSRLAMPTMLGG